MMTRATLIQAKFKARAWLGLPANKRFFKRLGVRFSVQRALYGGCQAPRFSWIKYPSIVVSDSLLRGDKP